MPSLRARRPTATRTRSKVCVPCPSTRPSTRAPADHLHALVLRHAREATREPADDALGLPPGERVQRDLRPAELDAELLRALDRVEHRRDVQQRLGRDAAVVEADAAEPFVRI